MRLLSSIGLPHWLMIAGAPLPRLDSSGHKATDEPRCRAVAPPVRVCGLELRS
jgi:hypothetical protein